MKNTLRLVIILAILGGTISVLPTPSRAQAKKPETQPKKEKKPVKENRLAKEASPYLRQHAKNPVNWYPWGKEAFDKAKKENKPILLSIGYSTCHWCHVMERESFENEAIAKLLNENYVAIKLDREERPDVDKIYMTSYQVMFSENGGWPLNVFLTPDLKMFYGGTYFPPNDKGGRVGFESVLKQLHTAWNDKNDEVLESANGLTEHMKEALKERKPAESVVSENVLLAAQKKMMENADLKEGGWGAGPKFPQPSHLSFLLKSWKRSGDKTVLDFVKLTADKMADGGIYDHLAGGFHRYAVDGKWLVPHFEKMLYDQAQLLDVYLDLWLITEDEKYKQVAKGISDYIIAEMQDEDGGYYCAQDAQSEGKEGKCFCWTYGELSELLDADEFEVVIEHFGVTEKGNFYDHSDPEALPDQNVLSLVKGDVLLKGDKKNALLSGIAKMKKARQKRVPAMTDKKVLASWNGMMIGAMARSGVILGEQRYMESAQRAVAFIKELLWNEKKQRLAHRYFNLKHRGAEGIDVDTSDQAESYLLMLQATRKLYELTLDPKMLEWSIQLAKASQQLFFDAKQGGFYEAADVPDVVLRLKGDYDGAMPTASSVAVLEYLKLHAITGDEEFGKVAEMTFKAHGQDLSHYPTSLTFMLVGLDYHYGKKQRLVLVSGEDGLKEFIGSVNQTWMPNLTVLGSSGKVDDFTKSLKAIDGKITAYFCEGEACKAPVNDIEEFKKLLKDGK